MARSPRTYVGLTVTVAFLAVGWWLLGPSQLGGPTSYAVLSGNSMEPHLERGDLVLTRTKPSYSVGEVVLYEDHDLRGRAPGALPTLLSREIAAVRADTRRVMAADPDEAVTAALAMADPGDVLLVMYEHVDEVQDVLRRAGADPVEWAVDPAGPAAARAMSAALA